MIKRNYSSILMIFFVILSLACSTLLPGTSQKHPSGKIVFQSNYSGNFELYLIDVRTGDILQLTNNSSNDFSPVYIDFTDQIGFITDRNNGSSIYVMDRQGENTTKVLNDKNIAVDYPDWSSDGKFITASLTEDCVLSAKTCFYDIYVMEADGSNLVNLTETSASEWVPDWSPDGQRIAFSSDRDGDSEIYIMDKDGSSVEQITNNTGYDGRPRWSPDGTKLSFESDRDGSDWDIYIMDVDGSNPKSLTNNATNEFSQSWSPDGQWLTYASLNEGDNEIFIIDINGENQFRLTNNAIEDVSPIWLP